MAVLKTDIKRLPSGEWDYVRFICPEGKEVIMHVKSVSKDAIWFEFAGDRELTIVKGRNDR